MKTSLTLLPAVLIVLAATVNAQTAPSPEWKRYTVKGEEFSVALPQQPAVSSFGEVQPQLRQKALQCRLESSSGGVLYAIYAYENLAAPQPLTSFIREQTASYQPKLVSERVVHVNGFRGEEYSSLNQRNLFVEQFFATKRRLYRFSAYGASADHRDVRQFFSSIMLGENPEGITVSDGPGASLQPSDEKIYTAKEVDVKARMTDKPAASYTDEAKLNQVTGTVILKVLLARDGHVSNIKTISGLPFGLTERAIAAARQLRFIPAMKGGMPVSMWMQIEYSFTLN